MRDNSGGWLSCSVSEAANNRGVIQLVECVVWDHDAAGSSPVAPTNNKKFDFSYKL